MKCKNQSGITLVALIVTIIVLLIIAGITIGVISGKNGILNRAENARTEYIVGEEKEKIEMAYEAAAANNADSEIINEVTFKTELDRLVGENQTEVTQTGTNEFEIIFKNTKNEYMKSADDISKLSKKSMRKVTSYTYGPTHDNNFVNVLFRSGALYRHTTPSSSTTGFVEFKENEATKIADNVKDFTDGNYTKGLFYRTKDNKLYYFNETNSEAQLLGENVDKYQFHENGINRLYFITSNKDLYEFNINSLETLKLSENVKEYYIENSGNVSHPIMYLDSNNSLYTYQGLLISENVKKVSTYVYSSYYYLYYITEDNDVYKAEYNRSIINSYEQFSKHLYGRNAKIVKDSYYIDFNNNLKKCTANDDGTVIASNVKEFKEYNRDYYYLDYNNNLYIKDKKIAENVKEFDQSRFLDNNNDFYGYSYFDKDLISENVEKFYGDNSYLKKDGTLIISNGGDGIPINNVTEYYPETLQVLSNGKKIYIKNNEQVIASGTYWYQTTEGKIYYYSYNRNDIGW